MSRDAIELLKPSFSTRHLLLFGIGELNVRAIRFRQYAVAVSSKQAGATYTVEFVKQWRERFAACTCKAGEREQACYHIAVDRAILNF